MKSKYELILLDADGTLFDYEKAEAYALEQAFRHFSLPFQNTVHLPAYQIINAAVWREFEQKLLPIEELRTKRFRLLFAQTGVSVNETTFSEIYLTWLGQAAFLLDGAENLLICLKSRYKLCLLTNGLSDVQRSRLRLSPLQPYFDAIIISDEVGCAKPQPEIFDHAFRAVNHTDKTTTLMVGDSLSSDIQGGLNYGISTCWYNPAAIANPTTIKPAYEVRSFQELIRLLD